MGIGNMRGGRSAPASTSPHYPSWGSGTIVVTIDAGGPIVSLPLMGIGNVGQPDALRNRPGLTTPHGDREPEPDSEPATAKADTHYPSWGSGTDAITLILRDGDHSLPLMGIGNENRRRGDRPDSPSSLPLMGIGNHFHLDSDIARPGGSLPLMGIGNSESERAVTPYSFLSLPLMGIGNPPYSPSFPSMTGL